MGLDASGLTMGIERARARIAELVASANQTASAMGGMERTMAAASASTAFLGDAMMMAAERTTSFSDRQRQQAVFTRELIATRARLAETLAGEGTIASSVAARYAGLSNVQRAQLIEVKEQIVAIELKARAETAAAAAAKAASAQAVQAAEAEAAAEVKAALAAGQLAAAEKGRVAAAEEAAGAAATRTGLLAFGAAAVLSTAEAVKLSIEFNKAMANVGSLIPGNVARLNQLKGAVQDLAQETGKDTKEIATGAYQIISSFGDSADTAKLLAINTKLAIGGVADVGKTIGLTAAVTKTYGDHSAEAVQHVADLAAMTVRLGHTTLPELNASIGAVAPLAAQMNVSMETLFGTLATGSGVTGNMARVSTQLRGILAGFANPTKAMVAVFNEAGVASGKALIEQRGFAGAIKLVVDEAERTDTPLQKYFHRIEATTLALPLAGAQAESLTRKIEAMSHASGASTEAFKAQQGGAAALGTELGKLKQSLIVLGQTFGDVVSPPLTAVTRGINSLLQGVKQLGSTAGQLLPSMGKGLLGVATGNFFPGEDPKARYQQMVDQARAGYLTGLSPGGGAFVGGPVTEPAAAVRRAPQPTKAQMEAHDKIVSTMEAQAFDTVRAKAVLLHGELSNQVGALDLYRMAYEKLTGAQQHNVREFENNIRVELKAKDALDARKDAVKEAAKAEEKAAEERRKHLEDYRKFLREQQVGTRVAQGQPGAGLAQFRLGHPDFSRAQATAAYNAEQWRKHHEALSQEALDQEKADQALRDTMEDQLKQAQLDAMSERAKRKFGEVNRESLALDSQWNKHYADLAPRQQKIIDQLYQLAAEKQVHEQMDREFVNQAQARIKAYDDEQKAIEKQTNAMIDLNKAMAERHRQREKEKQDDMDRRINEWVQKQQEAAEKQRDALRGYAEGFASVFTQAFRDVQDGSKGFFRSIVQGFEHMLQEMALKYIESKIANLFFGILDQVFGGKDPLNVPERRAGGGYVAPGQQYLVGERGPEMFTPGQAGRITPNARLAGAGGPNITFNITTPDVSGFQRSRSQLAADWHRESENARRRNGG